MVFQFFRNFFKKKSLKKVHYIRKDKKYFIDDPLFKNLIMDTFNLDDGDHKQIKVLSDSLVNFYKDPKAKTSTSFKGIGTVSYFFRGGEEDIIRILSFKLSYKELEEGKTTSDILNSIYSPKNKKIMHPHILSKGHVSDPGVFEEFKVEEPIKFEPVYKSLFVFEDLFFEICVTSEALRKRVKKVVFDFKKDFELKHNVKKNINTLDSEAKKQIKESKNKPNSNKKEEKKSIEKEVKKLSKN